MMFNIGDRVKHKITCDKGIIVSNEEYLCMNLGDIIQGAIAIFSYVNCRYKYYWESELTLIERIEDRDIFHKFTRFKNRVETRHIK